MFATSRSLRHLVLGGAVSLFALLPGLAHAQDQGQCWARTDAQNMLEQQSLHVGAGLRTLSGSKAESFLAVVNATGEPTDFHAEEITIVLLPQTHTALVFLTNHGCTDPGPISIGAELLLKAYKAAMMLDV
ncbi:hypothetical protein [Methylovirgula sp. 4M-Z18]|uniref:hypothetical protein n=1 Tax=Methylovirgula sp. 4M-Z18 TaxID=2293567 RepID=UPI000E2E9A41|nr:hypothetical protein [Methylovirgula sp. 4M-Z18]RFB80036.1 hypothetical protein DYH55_00335 [Methylovirgula sp. 4M-Z18]